MGPADVITLLLERGQTAATAESCTGGLLGKMLTDIPGSSGAYLGGVISYTCPVKEKLLGVDHETLETLGPVSKPVARQMAEGARRVMNADFGLATTGLAGPDGEGSDKQGRKVYVSLAGEGWTLCDELRLTGDRGEIRARACEHALQMLWNALTEQ